MNPLNPDTLPPFSISCVFKAAPERLWKAWTEPDELRQWWGPKGSTVEKLDLDLVPGGVQHYHLTFPDGRGMWGRSVYREVTPPQKLQFVNSFSNAEGGVTRHPAVADWPLAMLTTVSFRPCEGGCAVWIECVPVDPTEAERKTFEGSHDLLRGGWTGSLKRLAEWIG